MTQIENEDDLTPNELAQLDKSYKKQKYLLRRATTFMNADDSEITFSSSNSEPEIECEHE